MKILRISIKGDVMRMLYCYEDSKLKRGSSGKGKNFPLDILINLPLYQDILKLIRKGDKEIQVKEGNTCLGNEYLEGQLLQRTKRFLYLIYYSQPKDI